MIHVALYQPEIPPNTGNIMRLCANTGAQLHLIHPLAFTLDDKRMRRAGLDYYEWAQVIHYPDWEAFITAHQNRRIFCLSSKAKKYYHEVAYTNDDILLFGPETRGLPPSICEAHNALKIPMVANSRSLNLSNSVAVVLYEACRQLQFSGLS